MSNSLNTKTITIVSGLPRSGTSMMMAMLEAGGMELVVDNQRKADEDNPKGYYELEIVKELEKDTTWLAESGNKAVKVISMLLYQLPKEFNYKIIFMQRLLDEILASQKKMLERRGEPLPDKAADLMMKNKFDVHLRKTHTFIEKQENMDALYVRYREIINHPLENAEKINRFLGGHLDVNNMAGIVDKSLYRQRKKTGKLS